MKASRTDRGSRPFFETPNAINKLFPALTARSPREWTNFTFDGRGALLAQGEREHALLRCLLARKLCDDGSGAHHGDAIAHPE